jgi:hypothetical protein
MDYGGAGRDARVKGRVIGVGCRQVKTQQQRMDCGGVGWDVRAKGRIRRQ